jgi:hypothetical protein
MRHDPPSRASLSSYSGARQQQIVAPEDRKRVRASEGECEQTGRQPAIEGLLESWNIIQIYDRVPKI